MMTLPKGNRFFRGFENKGYLNDNLAGREEGFSPSVNIAENNWRYKIEMGLPGFQKHDFKIDLESDCLIIRGEKEDKENYTQEEYTRQEFSLESFEKSFQLPENVDDGHITAHFKDGLLEIELLKRNNTECRSKIIKIS